MGFILDSASFPLYEKWLRSPMGRAMDEFTEEFIIESLKPRKNERVLDIGCGMGNSLLILNRLGIDATGIDASLHMIDLTKNRLGNKCELKTGRAEDLPFSDNEFDFALLINTLEYLDDPLSALMEAGRVARTKVLICTINSISKYYLSTGMQGFFKEDLVQHIRPYGLFKLKSLIRNAYGKVPAVWRCKRGTGLQNQWNSSQYQGLGSSCRWPFGPILGLSVTLKPMFRTANLPLKIAVKKLEQPFAGGMPAHDNRRIAT
jgi:ubiquinone/menaquinone biosynthesis C-methylase UbiE